LAVRRRRTMLRFIGLGPKSHPVRHPTEFDAFEKLSVSEARILPGRPTRRRLLSWMDDWRSCHGGMIVSRDGEQTERDLKQGVEVSAPAPVDLPASEKKCGSRREEFDHAGWHNRFLKR
jgi:hypothetical protein